MSIGTNIAKYRKAKKYTQEQLGNLLGVTNQAISKWENEIALPDVMIIPQIAKVLSVTLDEIYGIDNVSKSKSSADDFPSLTHDHLIDLFYENCGIRFNNIEKEDIKQIGYYIDRLSNGMVLFCRSNDDGNVYIDHDFAYIDKGHKRSINNGLLNVSPKIQQVFNLLTDVKCMKVLEYQSKIAFSHDTENNIEFSADDIAKKCNLSGVETIDALEKLTYINIDERISTINFKDTYHLKKSEAVFVFAILRIANILLSDKPYLVLRDSSVISDYAFEIIK